MLLLPLVRRVEIALLAIAAIAAGAEPAAEKNLLRVPVWADARDGGGVVLGESAFNGMVDGRPAAVVATQGPGDDLVVLLVLDLSEELNLADVTRDALISAVGALPPNAAVALLRAQDGLRVVLDPTVDRAAVSESIRAVPVTGKAGFLDSVETAARIANAILVKTAVRVAIVYITDSNIYNYREDFTNPVINSSDQHDMSRYFRDGLIREKISKLEAKLALYEAPLFVVHVAYRSDRLNEAYQTGLLQLASACGGSSVFCRSRAEVPEAIAGTLRSVASQYRVVLAMPRHPSKVVQVQLESAGHALVYRNRFAVQR